MRYMYEIIYEGENTPRQKLICPIKIMTNVKLRYNQGSLLTCLLDCLKKWNKCIEITDLILNFNLANSIETCNQIILGLLDQQHGCLRPDSLQFQTTMMQITLRDSD